MGDKMGKENDLATLVSILCLSAVTFGTFTLIYCCGNIDYKDRGAEKRANIQTQLYNSGR